MPSKFIPVLRFLALSLGAAIIILAFQNCAPVGGYAKKSLAKPASSLVSISNEAE